VFISSLRVRNPKTNSTLEMALLGYTIKLISWACWCHILELLCNGTGLLHLYSSNVYWMQEYILPTSIGFAIMPLSLSYSILKLSNA
jgi:hypothetical protein